jgi:hypothetical protein
VSGNDSVNWGSLGPSGTAVLPGTPSNQTFSIRSTDGRSLSVASSAGILPGGGGANLTVAALAGLPSLLNTQHFAIATPPLPEFDVFDQYNLQINFNTAVAAAGADVLAQASSPGMPAIFEVVAFDSTTANIGQYSGFLGDSTSPTSGFFGLRSDSGARIASILFQIQFEVQSRFSSNASLEIDQLDFIAAPAASVPEPSALLMSAIAVLLGLVYAVYRRQPA